MYTSTLFRGRMEAVESSCDIWFVLSAKHGLLDPNDVIEPYDVALKNLPSDARRAWSRKVLSALLVRFGDLSGKIFEIHASSAYRDNGLVSGLKAAGATVENPTEGLNRGRQLAYYGGLPASSFDPLTRGPDRPCAGYGRIGETLDVGNKEPVTFSFAEVEDILGRPLPASARKYAPWWGNTDLSPQGRGWLDYGWRVGRIRMGDEEVRFERQSRHPGRAGGRTRLHAANGEPPNGGRPTVHDDIQLENIHPIASFTFRWPDSTEAFDHGWEATIVAGELRHRVRHGIDELVLFGSLRPHSVTFLDGKPAVEAAAEDTYEQTRKLVSLIKGADGRDVRERTDLPAGYEKFDICRQKDAIDAPHARSSLAVRLAEDDLEGWARHAHLRAALRRSRDGTGPAKATEPPQSEPAQRPVARPSPAGTTAIVAALLDRGALIAARPAGQSVSFTPNVEANQFVIDNPLAFLLAVICDQGIKAERAWAVPWELRRRLGHLDPYRRANEPESVVAAFRQRPMLHRLVNVVPPWIVDAARRVVAEYGRDAGRIWADSPSAVALQARLIAFEGIGQKKAAMAVEILERDLGVPISDLAGSDVAYDVHVRRVFLRTGLAEADVVGEMVADARTLNPDRPGSLDFPAWDIGRRWCRPVDPRCSECALSDVCPRLIDRADSVRGM
jgi:uncharacterized HhH-GPD family protein